MLEGFQYNGAQTAFVQALSAAYRNREQLWNPVVWEHRERELEEKMGRHGDIRGALSLRYSLVAGRTFTVLPKNPRAHNAPLVLLVANQLLSHLQKFTEARKLLASACFSGSRFARIEWMPRELTIGDGQLRTWLVPVGLRDADVRTYRIAPDWKPDEDEVRSYWQRWNIARGRWQNETVEDDLDTIRHVYGNRQGSLGYGDGLKDALGYWWYASTEVFADSLAAVARFAQGMLMVKARGTRDAAGLPNKELMDAWRKVLEEMKANNILVLDAQDEVQMLEMSAAGHQMLTDIRKDIRSAIYTIVLGANLTVAADSGGSFALGTVQKDNQDSVVQGDRDGLEESLSRYLLGNMFARNRPNLIELGINAEDDCPLISLAEEQKREPLERIQVAEAATRVGLPLAQAEVYDAIGFSPPEEGEPVLTPPPAPASPFSFDPGALQARERQRVA